MFVIDHGANIVVALRGCSSLHCNIHILNVVLSSAFAPTVLAKTPELFELLINAKQLVEYLKHLGLQKSLKEILKPSVETRRNSNSDMLNYTLEQYEDGQ